MATYPETGSAYEQTPAIDLPVARTRRRWPGLRVSERRLLLLGVDLLLVNAALAVTVLWRTDLLRDPADLLPYAKWFVTLSLIWVLAAFVLDAYDLPRSTQRWESARAALAALVFSVIIYWAVPWFTPTLVSRSLVLVHAGLAAPALLIWRIVYAGVIAQAAFQRTALVVGAGVCGRALAAALHEASAAGPALTRGVGYRLVGFIDDDASKAEQTVCGLPVLGDNAHLVRLARTLGVDQVVVAISASHRIAPELFEALLDCQELGVPVVHMTALYEQLTGRVPAVYAGRDITTVTQRPTHPLTRFYGGIRFVGDYVAALLGLLALAVLIPIVALANRLFSPGPLFYRQQRVGKGGKPFTVLKFRSMCVDAEADGTAVWARKQDDRITPVGRWLRKSHLDELPQVWNMLKREMSMVGPRPERPEFVGRLARDIPYYRVRHSVRPGITGWAQVHHEYGDSVEGAQEKLEYDLYYVKHANPLLDAVILLRTVRRVLGLQGR